jgi:hypothetical protein
MLRRLVVTLMASLLFAAPAQAAAPRYILVTGPGLVSPVLLGNWTQNLRLMMETVNAPALDAEERPALAHRVRLRLALFWGWPAKPKPRWPSQANQFGWLYPASPGAPAVIAIMAAGEQTPGLATSRLLSILAQHHVPVALDRG